LRTFKGTEGSFKASAIGPDEWNFTVGEGAETFEQLNRMSPKLGDVASIFVGLQTSADRIYTLEHVEELRGGFVRVLDRNAREWQIETLFLKRFLSNVSLGPFQRPRAKHWLVFPYRLSDGNAVFVHAHDLQRES